MLLLNRMVHRKVWLALHGVSVELVFVRRRYGRLTGSARTIPSLEPGGPRKASSLSIPSCLATDARASRSPSRCRSLTKVRMQDPHVVRGLHPCQIKFAYGAHLLDAPCVAS